MALQDILNRSAHHSYNVLQQDLKGTSIILQCLIQNEPLIKPQIMLQVVFDDGPSNNLGIPINASQAGPQIWLMKIF